MEKYYKFISNLKKFPEGIKQQDICAMMAVTIWNISIYEIILILTKKNFKPNKNLDKQK